MILPLTVWALRHEDSVLEGRFWSKRNVLATTLMVSKDRLSLI